MTRTHYELPLAYLLGLEGVALMRAFNGEHDREFVEQRLAEVRRLLDAPQLESDGVDVVRVDIDDGYARWADTYDSPHNELLELDIPVVREILADIEPGMVLDAACGTGRLAEIATEAGHRVVGVDASAEMLAKAMERLPDTEFHRGDLHELPLADNSVDVVMSGLALTHVRSLEPVLAEFARVLRPGGRVVISDVHPELVAWGSVPPIRLADDRPARIATYRHRTGDYVRAALGNGLQVLRCEELSIKRTSETPPMPNTLDVPAWGEWPWALADLAPRAARAASEGMGSQIILELRLL